MKRPLFNILMVMVTILPVVLSGCSASRSSKTAANVAVRLEYTFTGESPLSYVQTSSTDQYMDVQGQSVSVATNTYLGFGLSNIAPGAGTFEFDVVLDSLAVSVSSPMMEDPGMSTDVKGKGFKMSIKSNGKAISLGDASKIQIGNAMTGGGDVGATFHEVFPVLPLRDVKPGDVWSASDTLFYKTSAMEMNTISKGDYLFTGYEPINGRNCALITATSEGTRHAKMNSQGMDMMMTIPFKGTEKIWFDPSQGVVVKYEAAVSGTGQVEVIGMGMTIDVNTTIRSTLELAGK